MSHVIKCDRCGRRYRGHGEWNIVLSQGIATGFLCPDCQTPEENAEAVINEATVDYSRAYLDECGRYRTPTKLN